MNESERRAANNDLMDPDWKPNFPKVKRIGDMIDDLLLAVRPLYESIKKGVPLDLEYSYKTSASAQTWNKFIDAYEKLDSFTEKESK